MLHNYSHGLVIATLDLQVVGPELGELQQDSTRFPVTLDPSRK